MIKIFNWLFGACFRTLGKFLAIFIIGALLVFIGSKIGFDMPSWLALRVNAAYADGWIRNYDQLSRVNLYEINSSSLTSLDVAVDQVYIQDLSEDYNVSQYRDMFYYDSSSGFNVAQRGFIYEFGIDKTLSKDYLYSYSVAFCTNQDSFGSNYDVEVYGGWYGSNWNQGANTNTDILQYNSLNSMSIRPFGGSGSSNFKSCYQMNGYIVPDHNIAFMHLHFNKISGSKTGVMVYMLGASIESQGLYTDSIRNIFSDVVENGDLATGEQMEQVQQQVDDVKQEIQQTQDTITNGDITGAEDSASGFFNDFSTDTFGLTSIITAPLNSINNIINASCSSLVLPLPFVNKNLTLPCMTSIYSNYFKGFFDLYQIITTGLISYYVIVRIFNLIKDFKNPEHDEIEVVDL